MIRKSILISMILGLLGLTAVAFVIYKVNDSINGVSMKTDGAILPGDSENESKGGKLSERDDPANLADQQVKRTDFYALLIGLDYRPGSYTLNTDTIIAAHIIPQTGKVKLISLPRDLRVESNGEARKINALFFDGYSHARQASAAKPELLSGTKISLGGWTVPEEYFSSGMVHLREKVEDLLDIEIKHSFLIHFETLIELVDAVGGVEIEVERSMQYDDPTDGTRIYFEPGVQMLDGQQALNYARFRQDNRGPAYYSNDFERAERQQAIITALADKLSSWQSLTRVFDILNVVSNSFKTDMSKTQIVNFLTKHYASFNGESIATIPFEGTWQAPYVVVDDQELHEIREQFVAIDNEPFTSTEVSLR